MGVREESPCPCSSGRFCPCSLVPGGAWRLLERTCLYLSVTVRESQIETVGGCHWLVSLLRVSSAVTDLLFFIHIKCPGPGYFSTFRSTTSHLAGQSACDAISCFTLCSDDLVGLYSSCSMIPLPLLAKSEPHSPFARTHELNHIQFSGTMYWGKGPFLRWKPAILQEQYNSSFDQGLHDPRRRCAHLTSDRHPI